MLDKTSFPGSLSYPSVGTGRRDPGNEVVLDVVYSWIGKKNAKYYLKRREKLFPLGSVI